MPQPPQVTRNTGNGRNDLRLREPADPFDELYDGFDRLFDRVPPAAILSSRPSGFGGAQTASWVPRTGRRQNVDRPAGYRDGPLGSSRKSTKE